MRSNQTRHWVWKIAFKVHLRGVYKDVNIQKVMTLDKRHTLTASIRKSKQLLVKNSTIGRHAPNFKKYKNLAGITGDNRYDFIKGQSVPSNVITLQSRKSTTYNIYYI